MAQRKRWRLPAGVSETVGENAGLSSEHIQLVPLLSEEQVASRVKELSREISDDCRGLSLLAVGVLKGAFVFLADLVRQLSVPVRVDFISLSSYGPATVSSGTITVRTPLSRSAHGCDVLLVEDIVDTGLSIDFLCRELARQRARSLRVCTLLDKPSRRVVPVELDYVGFTVPDRFVVGYGIDYKEQFRHLPYIAFIEPSRMDRSS